MFWDIGHRIGIKVVGARKWYGNFISENHRDLEQSGKGCSIKMEIYLRTERNNKKCKYGKSIIKKFM